MRKVASGQGWHYGFRRFRAGLLGSAALLLAAGACGTGVAHAQAARTVSVNVRAQDLGAALTIFADQAGLRLLLPSGVVAGRTSPALSGTMTREEALSRLLAGTGLSYRFTSADTVTIGDRVSAAHAPVDAQGALVLDPVDVVGTGGADAPYRTPASVNHISREELDRTGGTSTSDIFRNTPGVIAADGRNSPAIEVNIRGVQGMNRTPVRVDGTLQNVPVYLGYFGASNRTYVDPDLLAGIDITKGPGAGADGAGSIGGVINMRTLDADDIIKEGKDWGIRLRGSVSSNSVSAPPIGTFDKRIGAPGLFDIASGHGSIVAARRFGDAEIVAGLARRKQGNYFTGRHGPDTILEETTEGSFQEHQITAVKRDSEIVNSQREVLSAYVKGKASFDGGHSVEASYVYYDSDFGEVMPSQVSRFGWDFVGQQEPNQVTAHRLIAKYGYKPDDSDLIDLRFNVWGTLLDQKTRSATPVIWDPNTLPINSRSIVPIDTYMVGSEISNTSSFHSDYGDLTLNYGASYLLEDTKPLDEGNWYLPQNGRRHEGSAFARFDYAPLDWLSFNGGLRYTAYKTKDRISYRNYPQYEQYFLDEYGISRNALDGSGWSPHLGVVLTPVDSVQLFANYTTGYRGPSLTEANFKYDFFPNPYLKAERSQNWELGANVLKDDVFVPGDKLRLKVAYFDNTIKDYIARGTFTKASYPWLGMLIPYNMGAAKFAGTEASASYDAGSWFVEANGIRYSRIAFCDGVAGYGAGLPVAGCVNHSLPEDYSTNYIPPEYTLSGTLGVRLFDERLTIGARVSKVGKRAISAPSSLDGGLIMPKKLWAPYTVVDAFASYKVNDSVTVSFSGENLTNRFYMDAMSLAAVPAPGRTFRASVTTNF